MSEPSADHPAVHDGQLFPPLAKDIEDALRASIQRFGVLVPVVKDQLGRTLDGHHRSHLADELGVPYRVDVVAVADEAEAREVQRTLNADRRQLTVKQRREVVVALKQEGHSYRAIAGALGMARMTAYKDVYLSGVHEGTPAAPERVNGLDGKSYPAMHKLPPEPPQREKLDRSPAARAARVERARSLASEGASDESIARAIGLTIQGTRALMHAAGIPTLHERTGRNRRRLDLNRVMSNLLDQVLPPEPVLTLLDDNWQELDPAHYAEWLARLDEALAVLKHLRSRLNQTSRKGSAP